MTSTYTVRTIMSDFVSRTKTEWSEWHQWKSMPEMVMLNFSNYALGLCLRFYVAFLRQTVSPPEQQNLEIAPHTPPHEDLRIKKAFLTSSRKKGHDKLTSTENKILIEFIWATARMSQNTRCHRSEYNLWPRAWPYTDPPIHLGGALK